MFVFCFGCYARAQCLSWVVHQAIVRAFHRYLFRMKYIYIFHVSSNMYKLWLLLCYLRVPFQLGSTPGFHVVHIPKGNLVLLCIIVFFWPLTFFSLPAAGLSSCSRFLWYARSPPRPLTQVWVLAKVRGTCSGGSKWQVRSARDSEHVEPSRPMKTHVHNSCGTF